MKQSYLRWFTVILMSVMLVFAGCSDDDDKNNQNNQNNQTDVGMDTGDTDDTGDTGDTGDANGTGDVEEDTDQDTGDVEEDTSDEDTGDVEEDTSDEDTGDVEEPTPIPSDLGPVESCDEITAIESVDCFSNADCSEPDQRCENVGGDEFYVPCCVPGERGTRPAGASCAEEDGDLRCASGLCIERNEGEKLCSQFCETNEDCPEAVPNCEAIPFLGSVCVSD